MLSAFTFSSFLFYCFMIFIYLYIRKKSSKLFHENRQLDRMKHLINIIIDIWHKKKYNYYLFLLMYAVQFYAINSFKKLEYNMYIMYIILRIFFPKKWKVIFFFHAYTTNFEIMSIIFSFCFTKIWSLLRNYDNFLWDTDLYRLFQPMNTFTMKIKQIKLGTWNNGEIKSRETFAGRSCSRERNYRQF